MAWKNSHWVMFVLLCIALSGCGVYSFTGASIDPAIRTYTVNQFVNNAPLVIPTLAQVISERMRDKMNNQTSLKGAQRDGDVVFSGTIVGYSVAPAAITANNNQTALNRLTITVQVHFENKVDPKKNFDEAFSQFQDFSNQPLTQVQDELNRQITQRIVDAAFNRAFVNW